MADTEDTEDIWEDTEDMEDIWEDTEDTWAAPTTTTLTTDHTTHTTDTVPDSDTLTTEGDKSNIEPSDIRYVLWKGLLSVI